MRGGERRRHSRKRGKRNIDVQDAVASMIESKILGWPDAGARAAGERLEAVVGGPGNITSRSASWERASGVMQGGAQSHERRTHIETIRRAVVIDQSTVNNLACVEHIVRRLVQIDRALESNLRQLDFTGRRKCSLHRSRCFEQPGRRSAWRK